jgi:hypothetical protein
MNNLVAKPEGLTWKNLFCGLFYDGAISDNTVLMNWKGFGRELS